MPIMRCPFFATDEVEALIEEALEERNYLQAREWMIALREMSAFSPT